MRLQSQKMSVLGNNIANSTSIAYKGGGMSFIDTYRGFTGQFANGNVKNVGNGIKVGNIFSDWTNGSVKETGLSGNMALSGEGFFHVMSPDGVTNSYTRAGEFSLVETSSGSGVYELMRPDGSVLMGTDDGGTTRSAIRITGFPDSWAVGTDGTIDVAGASAISVATPTGGTTVQISMADFSNPNGLVREDNGLYTDETGQAGITLGLAEAGSIGSITQGALEMSNVDLVNEFTELVLTQRAYSANSKTITTASEMLQEVLNLKR